MKILQLLLFVPVFLCAQSSKAQKFICKDGFISFFSKTPAEDIEAKSAECSAAIDFVSGDMVFVVPIKSFKFERSLMEEHFNENYLESEKYPKAFFKGNIDKNAIDFKNDGNYRVIAKGKLTIHNVTQEVSIPGNITIKNGKAIINAQFDVRCEDYKIKIPKLVMMKIAEEIKVTLNNTLNPL